MADQFDESSPSHAANQGGGSAHMTLFRKVIMAGRDKQHDYVSDATQAPPSRRTAAAASSATQSQRDIRATRRSVIIDNTGGPGEGAANAASPDRDRPAFWASARQRQRELSVKIIYSPLYKAFLVVMIFILLFGFDIQMALFPAGGDTACDAIYMSCFVIFLLDILTRCDIEPGYFVFKVFCIRPGYGGGWFHTSDNWDFAVGSFLFWCDLISTLTLLYSISWTNPRNFDAVEANIQLNRYGIPICGLNAVNAASPVEIDMALFVTVGKTARVARFIRSTTALKISSKVNWFYYWNLMNPIYWCQLVQRCASDRLKGTEAPQGVRARDLSEVFGSSRSTSAKSKHRAPVYFASPEESGFLRVPRRALKFLRLIPRDDEEWKQNLAATKIQRAWRASKLRRTHRSMAEPSSMEWGPDDAWRRSSSNPIGKEMVKRSLLKRLSVMRSLRLATLGGGTRRANDSTPGVTASGAQSFSRSKSALSSTSRLRNESQVGTAMRELTGQRVATGIVVALALTVLFTYVEQDATRPSTMIVLHTQTTFPRFANKSLDASRATSVPDLYFYQFANDDNRTWDVVEDGRSISELRPREIYKVEVCTAPDAASVDTDIQQCSCNGVVNATTGKFVYRDETKLEALVNFISTLFILLVWFFGVTAFAGPVMALVVVPIERMVRLLGMLMVDPLGYESSPRYKQFIQEEDQITGNTRWTKEVLKGMETSFLMSTILRIGSLMKVGFGSAGVEIIRNNLEKNQNHNGELVLNSRGSRVCCIFLFSDIRQFTDATECLQEEVFVFTNRIAGVVHSICHSYGGSANKNIGDAFLLSWLLDDDGQEFSARSSQADKALLSVVKICMALHYDKFYIEPMSDVAREALLSKLAKRKGPVVQMGFGLHAGDAVQGAIGSQRKIDATYVSEHVERAEFLESSTKQYGVKMLMSDSFHRLLHPSNRRRCRKVDQIMIANEDDDEAEDDYDEGGTLIELLTFDMDIDALWKGKAATHKKLTKSDSGHESDSEIGDRQHSRRDVRLASGKLSRLSVRGQKGEQHSDEFSEGFGTNAHEGQDGTKDDGPPELVLPSGPAIYNANVWVSDEMKKIRHTYSDGLFFQKFNSGLQSFYARDWEHAKLCFETILERFEDGPSRYFMNQIEAHNGVPPRHFKPHGKA